MKRTQLIAKRSWAKRSWANRVWAKRFWRLISAMIVWPISALLLALIWLYRMFVSPLLGANCRHLPTCSQYAEEALLLHGPLRGGFYSLKRISRCHPWATPAFDPVPPLDRTRR
jgi:putative membrane protein insertion efficiency factor